MCHVTDTRIAEILPTLRTAHWAVIYEITRVCLHTDVSAIDFRDAPIAAFYKYEELWRYLREHTALQGKHFPEKISKAAWEAAVTRSAGKFNGVVLSGALQLNDRSSNGPLFKFRLQPIKLDLTHRAGRSLGNDRFLEIDVPSLAGNSLPKALADVGKNGRKIITQWLVNSAHALFGRSWKPFYNVKLKQKKKKKGSGQASEPGNRVYFFAVNGHGFEVCRDDSLTSETRDYAMSIDDLLGSILPIRENNDQSYLKLFSRISLGICFILFDDVD
jgi:RNA dependent RNA polymerase